MKSTIFFLISLLLILQEQVAAGIGFHGTPQGQLSHESPPFSKRPRASRGFGRHHSVHVSEDSSSITHSEPKVGDGDIDRKYSLKEKETIISEEHRSEKPNGISSSDSLETNKVENRVHRHFHERRHKSEKEDQGGYEFSKRRTVQFQHERND